MKRLQAELNYTNPATGSIRSGLEWVGDFEGREDQDQTWEEWGGHTLEEVEHVDDLEYRMQEEEREGNPERYYGVSGWF